MNFASDNAAGIAPEILAAISRANEGAALGYGRDPWTRRVEERFAALFAREAAVFLVPTGTAANALALAHLAPPWGAVLCHAEAHIATDECGAPEFYGGGLKLVGLAGEAGKIAPDTLRLFLAGLPALAVGSALGWWMLYGKLDEAAFRRVVLVLLLVSGIWLTAVGW